MVKDGIKRSLQEFSESVPWISELFESAMTGQLQNFDFVFEIGTLEENVVTSSIGTKYGVAVTNEMIVGRKANGGKYDFVSPPPSYH